MALAKKDSKQLLMAYFYAGAVNIFLSTICSQWGMYQWHILMSCPIGQLKHIPFFVPLFS